MLLPDLDLRYSLDPLMIATAAAATPSLTRNHYCHEYYPASVPAPKPDPVAVECVVRTRIPTGAAGNVSLFLYTNSQDSKEHLALVVDPPAGGRIVSDSLERPRGPFEADDDRYIRGASTSAAAAAVAIEGQPRIDTCLVRLHSECFTGETIGSTRCDCGEQLERALQAISLSGGVVVYLRQEGRGIGLREKMRAYNLQDRGHDTVTANIMLGQPADGRTYDIAAAILADLGIRRVRIMTNNPAKVRALEAEGVNVTDRVPLVPAEWNGAENGTELSRYLATKARRMGHLLS